MKLFKIYIQKKRELCTRIAERYREKSELWKEFGNEVKSTRCANSFFSHFIVEPFLGDVGNFYLKKGEEFERNSKRYENLAKSTLMHAVPLCVLHMILSDLESDLRI